MPCRLHLKQRALHSKICLSFAILRSTLRKFKSNMNLHVPSIRWARLIACCFLLFCCTNTAWAQVENDDCGTAELITGLSTTSPTCVEGTTNGSFAELPFINQLFCQGDVPFPVPASDVWYTFTSIGNLLDVTLEGDMDNLMVALYEGDCEGLIGRDCVVSETGDAINVTFAPVSPGVTYYLQVSGGSEEDQGDFELCVQTYETLTEICILEQTISLSPPPVLGSYDAGQIVTICLDIGDYEQNAADWFHGLVPVFGDGWNVATLDPLSPEDCTGTGTWDWYESVLGTSGSALPDPQGPGFFYETASGGPGLDDDPGNNYGDANVGDGCALSFCMVLETQTCPPGEDGGDLSITFLNFSDAETGSWTSESPCPDDPNFTFKAVLSCCQAPLLSSTDPTCASPTGGTITATAIGDPPFTYAWSTGITETSEGDAVLEGLPAGFYAVTVTDANDCESAVSVTLTEDDDPELETSIPVTVLDCGECALSPFDPQSISLINEAGEVLQNYTLTVCPTNILYCFPDVGSYGLQFGDQIIEGIVVDGVVTSDEPFAFESADGNSGLTMPISVFECGLCAASDDNPQSVDLVDDATGEAVANIDVTACPSELIYCFPDEGSFSLVLGTKTLDAIVVDGAFSGAESFEFELGDGDSDPGVMPSGEMVLCAGESTDLAADGVSILDEDAFIYALHTNSGAEAGDILAVNTTGVFSPDSGEDINTNTVYYISSVVGPEGTAPGIPDLASACTFVAPGTPVVFLNPVEILINEYCDWEFGDYYVTVGAQGGLPEYDDDFAYILTGDIVDDNLELGETQDIIFAEGVTSVYEFNIMDDGNGCTASAADDFICIKTPIELLSLTGQALSNGNLIEWVTATESNNDYFTLSRSTDGVNFSEIATVASQGDSESNQYYEWLDADAPAGLSYYHLQQTDLNGESQSAGIVTVMRDTDGTFQIVSISPVPAAEQVTVQFANAQSDRIMVQLFNVAGQVVYTQLLQGSSALSHEIDLRNMAAGVYLVSVTDGKETISSKLVKE